MIWIRWVSAGIFALYAVTLFDQGIAALRYRPGITLHAMYLGALDESWMAAMPKAAFAVMAVSFVTAAVTASVGVAMAQLWGRWAAVFVAAIAGAEAFSYLLGGDLVSVVVISLPIAAAALVWSPRLDDRFGAVRDSRPMALAIGASGASALAVFVANLDWWRWMGSSWAWKFLGLQLVTAAVVILALRRASFAPAES